MNHTDVYNALVGKMKKTYFSELRLQAGNNASIYFFDQRAARIYIGPKTQYILVFAHGDIDKPEKYDLCPENYDVIVKALDELWRLFSVYNSVERFGCCSYFTQCSDAKRCLFEERLMSYGCGYKRNLEAGRIFYGINKNI